MGDDVDYGEEQLDFGDEGNEEEEEQVEEEEEHLLGDDENDADNGASAEQEADLDGLQGLGEGSLAC